MKPTEELSGEHRVIEKAIGALECLAGAAKKEGKLDKVDAESAIDFIRTFADKMHHGKEEDRLFPAMEAHGLSAEAGPTAMMRQEHEIGRAHVRAMAGAVKGAASGEAAELHVFVEGALGYGSLLRNHIQKEDNILYPMALQVIPPDEMKALEAEFARVDKEMGPGFHAKYIALAGKLSDKYSVKKKNHALHNEGCSICGEGG